MSNATPSVTLLQPLDVPFFERIQQSIDFAAITTNPARTSFTDQTYTKKKVDDSILVDMSSSRVQPMNMQLVPLSTFNRRVVSRAVNRNDDLETMPIIVPETAPVYTGSGAQWFSSLLMLLLVTPSLLNILCMVAWVAASYYYGAAMNVGSLSTMPTFWDRTYWAVMCGLPVYASYYILDGIASLVERRALVQAFGARMDSTQDEDRLMFDPTSSVSDFWTGMWRRFVANLTPYVLFANFVWYLHLFARCMMKFLCYASVAFYVTVMLWSQYGVPFSVLPSANSPVVGAWIGAAERVLGPIVMPVTSAWTQSTYVMPTINTAATIQPRNGDSATRLEDYLGY